MADDDSLSEERDPELQAIWKKTGFPKPFFPRPNDMAGTRRLHAMGSIRFMKSEFVKQTLGEGKPWKEEERQIAVRDGSRVRVRIYRPTAHLDRPPVMLYAHSGGGCMGSLDTDAFIPQLLCMRLGLIVVSVGYRLAPELLFPTCVFDVYDAMKWVSINAHTFGGDLTKGFLAGGTSCGGNYMNSAAVLARDEGMQPPISGHFFMCTGMPHQFEDKEGNQIELLPEQFINGSWERYKDCPVANRELNLFYGELGKFQPDSPLFTPLTQKDFSGLGPVFYQVAGMDIWRDSALFYCDLVRKFGGKTKVEVYPGLPHLWWSMYPQLSINKKWARDLVDGVAWLLKQKGKNPVNARL